MRHTRVIHPVRLMLALCLAAIVLAVMPHGGARAQIGGTIGYGSSVLGKLAAADQSLTYSFSGNAGDLVQVNARNWTGTLDPRLDLVAPDGQSIATGLTSPFSGDPLEASLSVFLPQTGTYSLLVSGENGTTGEFLLKLRGRPPVTAIPLVPGQAVDVSVPLVPPPQYFSFDAQSCPTVLTVANLSEGQPFTFPFVVKVLSPQGTEIAQLYGGDALEDRLIVPAASGRYEVLVTSNDPRVQGAVRLLVTCADQVPGCVPGGPATGGTSGAAGGCPSCFGEDFGGELCATFEVTATREGGTASFTWPPVEGADHYIFSIVDASGALLVDSPLYITGETSHSYIFNPADLHRGPFTAIVSAGSEIEGLLCVDEVPVSFDDETTAECSGITVGADIVPAEERMAVLSWSAAPGAGAYTIHVYARDPDDGGLIGIRVFTVPGDATTYHLAEVFPADYTEFQISVHAYSEASGGGAFGDMPQGFLCSGETSIAFGPLGPVHWGPAA